MRLSGKRIKFTTKIRRTQRIHEEHIKEFTMCNLRALCVLCGEKTKDSPQRHEGHKESTKKPQKI